MKSGFLFSVLIVLIFCFVSACITVIGYPPNEGRVPPSEFYRIVPLQSRGTLSLKNCNGNVELEGWDRDELEVYADRFFSLRHPQRIPVFSWGLPVPDIKIDSFEDSVNIRTRPAGLDPEDCHVDYKIFTPRAVRLKDIEIEQGSVYIADIFGEVTVRVINGEVTLENFSGSFSATLDSGPVNASLFDLRGGDVISVHTKSGTITIYLEPHVNCDVNCWVPNGQIFSEFEFGELDGDKMVGRTGEGGASLTLVTMEGDIVIKKIEGGTKEWKNQKRSWSQA